MVSMHDALKHGLKHFAVGEIVKGTIIEIRPKEVLVDIGYKSEGSIPASEFEDLSALKPGDQIDVLIERLEDKDGMVVLSHEKAEFKKNWERILTICNEGGKIAGKVKSVVKGGLMVNIGVEAFVPASHVDLVTPKNLQDYVGKTFEFKVVKINQERQNVVLSRRELLEQERAERRAKLLAEMMPGDIRKGTVKNITDFGAFIDLNGIDGLLHITDMSWGRINHPSEMLKVGQEIDVVVLDVNREKERVSLGLKQKMPNPWDQIETKYPVGARVKGKVVNVVPYGAFVELEPGVEGLVHVTELSWTKRIAKASDVLKVGQEIEAVVLGINKEEQKISLGVRQLEPNPWDTADKKYPPGTRVKGKIRNLTSYGAFVELEDGLDGMIHVSDISWTRKINHPSEVLKKGEEVEAVVLEVDKLNQRIALGIKQLTPDPWENIDKLYRVGDLVTGKVTKLASFGAFVGLKHDIDGLVHISQISEERVDKIKNVLKVGQEVTARVIKIDRAERRIGLSIKAANYTPEQLQAEQKLLEALKPGEDLVALQHAFEAAEEARQSERNKEAGGEGEKQR
ncbi:MAG: 30S ribosomal protein S1 [Verrucomicrobiae bacterium]|nr:30S ribosomal protein S1 [Verrucomicrobiae bacterium]MCX7722544.1 30S ribosomal protein S1 [Verrucomicrobiae bacterium]MDW7980357.1 30S ribosomal protein S1 [Verrucomicrobiales bacterium]